VVCVCELCVCARERACMYAFDSVYVCPMSVPVPAPVPLPAPAPAPAPLHLPLPACVCACVCAIVGVCSH